MKRGSSVILALVVVVIIGAVAWFATRPNSNSSSDSSKQSKAKTTQTQPAPQPASEPSAPAANAVMVNYDSSGFSPSTITVKSGQTLTFVNKTSSTIQPSSDPHPQHTDNPELNVGTISASQSKSITPKRTGTFGMHDHFNPSHTLSVTVE